jgi:DNA-binding NarL/FixJ family response regulator
MIEPCIPEPIQIVLGDVEQPRGQRFTTALVIEIAVTVRSTDGPAVEREPLDVAALPEDTHAADRLTEREREVLWLASEELTNQEIANRLVISESTTKRHMSNILRKLGVPNRYQAAQHPVAQAVRRFNRAA